MEPRKVISEDVPVAFNVVDVRREFLDLIAPTKDTLGFNSSKVRFLWSVKMWILAPRSIDLNSSKVATIDNISFSEVV